jgi:hypothetical protein
MTDNDYSSSRIGDDIIIIPTSELKDKNFIYAKVHCSKKCDFKIRAYYEDTEITILKDQELTFFVPDNPLLLEKIFIFNLKKGDKKFYEIQATSLNMKDLDLTVFLMSI